MRTEVACRPGCTSFLNAGPVLDLKPPDYHNKINGLKIFLVRKFRKITEQFSTVSVFEIAQRDINSPVGCCPMALSLTRFTSDFAARAAPRESRLPDRGPRLPSSPCRRARRALASPRPPSPSTPTLPSSPVDFEPPAAMAPVDVPAMLVLLDADRPRGEAELRGKDGAPGDAFPFWARSAKILTKPGHVGCHVQ